MDRLSKFSFQHGNEHPRDTCKHTPSLSPVLMKNGRKGSHIAAVSLMEKFKHREVKNWEYSVYAWVLVG